MAEKKKKSSRSSARAAPSAELAVSADAGDAAPVEPLAGDVRVWPAERKLFVGRGNRLSVLVSGTGRLELTAPAWLRVEGPDVIDGAGELVLALDEQLDAPAVGELLVNGAAVTVLADLDG